MSEGELQSKTEANSRRTQLLRQMAIARLDLFRDFMQIYPDFDPDTDMTDEQKETWDKLSAAPFACIAIELSKLEEDVSHPD